MKNLSNKQEKTQQAMIPITDKLSLTKKGKKVWDVLAPQSKYITNKIMNCGLDGYTSLPSLFNEEHYGELNELLSYHLDVETHERRTQQLMSIISPSRPKK